MELQLRRKHFQCQYKGKCFLLKYLPRPLLIQSYRACHELWALLLQLCPAEYALWELVHLFADDKITLRTCMCTEKQGLDFWCWGKMYPKRPAQTKSAPTTLSECSLCLELRAWYLFRLSAVGMQPVPALRAAKYSLHSQFPSQGCAWCCASPKRHSSVKCLAWSSGSDALSSYWSLKCNHLVAYKPVALFYQYHWLDVLWCTTQYPFCTRDEERNYRYSWDMEMVQDCFSVSNLQHF